MSSNAASIFHGKGNKLVPPVIEGRDGVEGVRVRLELLVLNLFSRKSWDHGPLRQCLVPVYGCNNSSVKNKMPSPIRKVQYHQVPRARSVIRANAPYLLNNGCSV